MWSHLCGRKRESGPSHDPRFLHWDPLDRVVEPHHVAERERHAAGPELGISRRAGPLDQPPLQSPQRRARVAVEPREDHLLDDHRCEHVVIDLGQRELGHRDQREGAPCGVVSAHVGHTTRIETFAVIGSVPSPRHVIKTGVINCCVGCCCCLLWSRHASWSRTGAMGEEVEPSAEAGDVRARPR